MFGWFKKKQKVVEEATEAMVEAIVEKIKNEEQPTYAKPKHVDCKCYKCLRWEQQNAK